MNLTSNPMPTSIFDCILRNENYKSGFSPKSYPGKCNLFGCNCDHCYGAQNCRGTNDAANDPKTSERARVAFRSGYYYIKCPEMAPFLTCPATAAADAPAVSEAQASGGSASLACADRDLVLSEPINATVARLSGIFCDPASSNGDVGFSFAGQMLDTLDADNSGSVSCTEWGLAKRRTTYEQLVASGAGGYFGPAKVDPPACKMSREGAAELAKYNAYLAKLTLATAASNTTAWVQQEARGSALAVEGRLVSNAAVGVATAAKEGLLAAWNRTVSSSSG